MRKFSRKRNFFPGCKGSCPLLASGYTYVHQSGAAPTMQKPRTSAGLCSSSDEWRYWLPPLWLPWPIVLGVADLLRIIRSLCGGGLLAADIVEDFPGSKFNIERTLRPGAAFTASKGQIVYAEKSYGAPGTFLFEPMPAAGRPVSVGTNQNLSPRIFKGPGRQPGWAPEPRSKRSNCTVHTDTARSRRLPAKNGAGPSALRASTATVPSNE